MTTLPGSQCAVKQGSASAGLHLFLPAPSIPAPAWHALAKFCGKQADATRDQLPPSSAYICQLAISGSIDGDVFPPLAINGALVVGFDTDKASSATPTLPLLIGNILAQLAPAHRSAILRNLPAIFAASGCELPAVAKEIEAETAAMLKALRAEKRATSRGPVSFKG